MSRSSLTEMVNICRRIEQDHERSLEIDTQFDAGEFSTGSIYRMSLRELRHELAWGHWTAVDFQKELLRRTTPKWVYFEFGFIDHMLDELIAEEDRTRIASHHNKRRAPRQRRSN